ncbi:hypothetical protein FACS1894184_05060 [Clostridia bacterium]|nr:hypothetical protein FACS1894184_05060 [Clostridia bacterium]
MSVMNVEYAGVLLGQTELAILTQLVGMRVYSQEGLSQDAAQTAIETLERNDLIRQTDNGIQVEEQLFSLLQRMADCQCVHMLAAGDQLCVMYESERVIILLNTLGNASVSLTPLNSGMAAASYMAGVLEEAEASSFVWGGMTGEPIEGDKQTIVHHIQEYLHDRISREESEWNM